MTSNQTLNLCSIFFNRLGGIWFLIGNSLAQFCCNRQIVVDDMISVGVYGVEKKHILDRFAMFDITLVKEYDRVLIGMHNCVAFRILIYTDSRKGNIECADAHHSFPKTWLQCSSELAQEIREKNPFMSDGLWRVPINETDTIEFRLPYMIGSVLDSWCGEWWKTIEHDPSVWHFNDVYFDEPRKKNGLELIGQMYECGKKAGIVHAMFIGYGTLLGFIRQGDFVPNDRDMDMCIVADWITVEQALAYVAYCKEAGLGEHRWVPAQCREDTGMPLWFSLGPKNPVSESGIKSCNWFWFSHGGYWWHSKGGMWVTPTKFSKKKTQYNSSDAAIAKGVPQDCLKDLREAKFNGVPVLVPDSPGACLDHWYKNWCVPKEGASAHEWILVIEKWEDKNTWRIG